MVEEDRVKQAAAGGGGEGGEDFQKPLFKDGAEYSRAAFPSFCGIVFAIINTYLCRKDCPYLLVPPPRLPSAEARLRLIARKGGGKGARSCEKIFSSRRKDKLFLLTFLKCRFAHKPWDGTASFFGASLGQSCLKKVGLCKGVHERGGGSLFLVGRSPCSVEHFPKGLLERERGGGVEQKTYCLPFLLACFFSFLFPHKRRSLSGAALLHSLLLCCTRDHTVRRNLPFPKNCPYWHLFFEPEYWREGKEKVVSTASFPRGC